MYTAGKVGYTSQFPFFKEVSTYITNMIEQNVAEVNENVDILQDNTASEFAAGMVDLSVSLCCTDVDNVPVFHSYYVSYKYKW